MLDGAVPATFRNRPCEYECARTIQRPPCEHDILQARYIGRRDLSAKHDTGTTSGHTRYSRDTCCKHFEWCRFNEIGMQKMFKLHVEMQFVTLTFDEHFVCWCVCVFYNPGVPAVDTLGLQRVVFCGWTARATTISQIPTKCSE